MIPFDTFTLAAVVAELRATISGARVQKIHQPAPNDVVLSLYGRGGAQRLLLCADPQNFRVHLTQVRRENPINAPAFCQVCRKYLEGAWLESIDLSRFDRVLRLVFRAHDGENLMLAAELMGRNANLVLVSGTGIVRGAIRAAPSEERPLRPGVAYAEPPGYQDRQDPLVLDAAAMEKLLAALPSPSEDAKAARSYLMAAFSGIGPFAADEVLARTNSAKNGVPEALAQLMEAVRNADFAPHSVSDVAGNTDGIWAFEPQSIPRNRRFPRDSISVALDTFYATRAGRAVEEAERSGLAKVLAREITFREREIAAARTTLAEATRADEYEQTGNLLLASLSLIPRGAATVTVPDLYGADGAERTVTLDPKRAPQENAERYFERARKARDAAEYAQNRIAEREEELAALRRLSADWERAETDEAREAVRHALKNVVGTRRMEEAGTQRSAIRIQKKDKPFGGHRVRTHTVEEYELLLGETAESNDYLTTRVAAPPDYWLHVRAGTGAHGILRTNGKPQSVPDPVLRRAAQIVAARSGTAQKHAGLVAVDVVERRYVRKPRGAKPGLVTYSRERTLDVTPGL